MAFIITSNKQAEVCRRGLVAGITIGRAPDCDLSIHDILLSRHHCRIEPSGRGWVVTDLRSKNGTWLDGERVGRRSLRHGEVIRAGNTTIRFMLGNLPSGSDKPPQNRKPRPADPFDAMAGTVVDFDPQQAVQAPDVCGPRPTSRTPYPRPIPREPAAYARDGVYSLLEEIASSSWDSIYANASRPNRTIAEKVTARSPIVDPARLERPIKRPGSPVRQRPPTPEATPAPDTLPVSNRSRLEVDFSLQAPTQRSPRSFRRAIPVTTAPVISENPKEPKSVARRAWQAALRALAIARHRIAPPGAIVLF